MKDFKDKLDKFAKTKKGKYTIIGTCLLVAVSVGTVAYKMNTNTLKLINEAVEVEYGQTYNPSLKEIVKDYKKYNNKDLKLENNIKNEEGKEYPRVGKYEIKVLYKKQEVTQNVEIKDTTKPELTKPENIEILQGTDLSTFDFKSLLSATDLSELKDYKIDYSKVDANTVGEYEASVSIQDKYENKTQDTVKVTIIEKPTINADEVVVQEIITNEDGTKTVKNTVKKQAEATDKKVVSNSNNTNINQSNSSTTSTGGSTSTSGNTSSNNNNNSNSTTKPTTKPSNNGSNTGSSSNSSTSTTAKPSTGSSNSSSNSGNSGTSNNGTASTQHTHTAVGNSGRWVNSYSEVESAFYSTIKYWGDKVDNVEIDWNTYSKNCPSGYTNVHSCTCGKITWDWIY